VRKLFVLVLFAMLTLSCAEPEQRTVRGGGARGRKESTQSDRTQNRRNRSTTKKFERDWSSRYSEKTVRKVYGLSKKQLKSAKKRLRKEKPSLATKTTQNPPGHRSPNHVCE
jgi:hypothetical protein